MAKRIRYPEFQHLAQFSPILAEHFDMMNGHSDLYYFLHPKQHFWDRLNACYLVRMFLGQIVDASVGKDRGVNWNGVYDISASEYKKLPEKYKVLFQPNKRWEYLPPRRARGRSLVLTTKYADKKKFATLMEKIPVIDYGIRTSVARGIGTEDWKALEERENAIKQLVQMSRIEEIKAKPNKNIDALMQEFMTERDLKGKYKRMAQDAKWVKQQLVKDYENATEILKQEMQQLDVQYQEDIADIDKQIAALQQKKAKRNAEFKKAQSKVKQDDERRRQWYKEVQDEKLARIKKGERVM